MDFSLNDEQTMLQDSIARVISNDYDFEKRQAIAASELGFSNENWTMFTDLGLTAVPFAEAEGGLDGGAVETMLIMEQFGRGLVLEPFLASAIMAGGVLRRVGSAAQKLKWLTGVIDGSIIGTLGYAEPQSRFELSNVTTRASDRGDHYVLSGKKSLVLQGGSANFIIVSARTAGDATDSDGISLFLIDTQANGVRVQPYPTVDGLRAAELVLDEVRVDKDRLLGECDAGLETLVDVVDDATLAVAAEALGIMQALNAKTLEYTKNRQQFGMPIAAFQALQHRMVDMFIEYEQTRSLLLWAVMSRDEKSSSARAAISAVKYRIGTGGRKLGEEAVQLHGGMGVTWELDVAHYFKRLIAIDTWFGNADYHLRRYAKLNHDAQ